MLCVESRWTELVRWDPEFYGILTDVYGILSALRKSACRLVPDELSFDLWFQAHAEADSFFCFVELLSDFRDNFCQQLDNSAVGVRATLSQLNALLRRADEELWRHLELTAKVGWSSIYSPLLWKSTLDLPRNCQKNWENVCTKKKYCLRLSNELWDELGWARILNLCTSFAPRSIPSSMPSGGLRFCWLRSLIFRTVSGCGIRS